MNLPVSIVIPTYNRANFLGETLDSVLDQSYSHWECVVVDDGSNDYTKELMYFYCERDPRIKYYQRPGHKQKGANACRNYGFEICLGDFIVFLDSDDLLVSSCLEKRMRYLEQNLDKDFLVFQSNLFLEKPGDSDLVPNYLYKRKDDIARFIMYDYPWNTSSAIIQKKFLIGNGIKWNEILSIQQDLDFYIKILCGKPKYDKIIDDPDVFIRMKGATKMTFSKISPTILKSKFLFVESIVSQLEKHNLLTKYKKELYGLSLSIMKLLYRHSSLKLYLKVPGLYIKNKKYIQAFSLLLDHEYLINKCRFHNRLYRKITGLYEYTGFKKRSEFLHPYGSTLGKVTITQHLKEKI